MKSEWEYRNKSFRRPKDNEMTVKIEHLKTSLKELEDKQDKLLYKIEKWIEKRNKVRSKNIMDRSYTHQPWIRREDIVWKDVEVRHTEYDTQESQPDLNKSNLSAKNRETEEWLRQEEFRL